MSYALLADFCAGLLVKLPLPDSWKEAYAKSTATGPDGRPEPILDTWRREFLKTLADISNQPAWALQKRQLLWHIIKESGWIALADVVRREMPVSCWRAFVEDVSMFKEIEERHYFDVLVQRRMLSMPTVALLLVVGQGAYGLNEKTKFGINFYKAHRMDFITAWVRIMEMPGHLDSLPEVKAEYLALLPQMTIVDEIRDFNTKIADRIMDGTFNRRQAKVDLDALNARKRQFMRELGGQIEDEGKVT